jgi:hypothetical protein
MYGIILHIIWEDLNLIGIYALMNGMRIKIIEWSNYFVLTRKEGCD